MMQDVRVYNTGSADYTRVGAESLDSVAAANAGGRIVFLLVGQWW